MQQQQKVTRGDYKHGQTWGLIKHDKDKAKRESWQTDRKINGFKATKTKQILRQKKSEPGVSKMQETDIVYYEDVTQTFTRYDIAHTIQWGVTQVSNTGQRQCNQYKTKQVNREHRTQKYENKAVKNVKQPWNAKQSNFIWSVPGTK